MEVNQLPKSVILKFDIFRILRPSVILRFLNIDDHCVGMGNRNSVWRFQLVQFKVII